jgi:hypothetical protein
MPHIVPNSARPINPSLVKPLRFVAGPADENLANAVRNLLRDVNNIFGATQNQNPDEDILLDIDELGQPIIRDEITGEILSGEGYYGWSKAFCERMKRLRKGLEDPGLQSHAGAVRRRRSRSRSGSRSSSRSRTSTRSSQPYKRRRYSDSEEERSRSRSIGSPRRNRWAYSRSPSPSRDRDMAVEHGRPPQHPVETSSQSTPRGRIHHQVLEPLPPHPPSNTSSSARRNLGPPYVTELSRAPNGHEPNFQDFLPPNLFPPLTSHNLGPGGVPIPPPPPPQYLGQWPPPPPPQMVSPQNQQGGPWPPLPPSINQGAQQWQVPPYGQPLVGGNAWPQTTQQGGNGRGVYGGRGQSGHNNSYQQSRGGGHNGYRGNGRGRGWSS